MTTVTPSSSAMKHRCQLGQDPAGYGRFSKTIRADLKRHRQYAASDVAADRLRVYQVLGADRHTNADVPGEVDVRHDGHMLHIGGAAKALDRIVNFTIKRIYQPRVQRWEH
jgi:hypothetical protein